MDEQDRLTPVDLADALGEVMMGEDTPKQRLVLIQYLDQCRALGQPLPEELQQYISAAAVAHVFGGAPLEEAFGLKRGRGTGRGRAKVPKDELASHHLLIAAEVQKRRDEGMSIVPNNDNSNSATEDIAEEYRYWNHAYPDGSQAIHR